MEDAQSAVRRWWTDPRLHAVRATWGEPTEYLLKRQALALLMDVQVNHAQVHAEAMGKPFPQELRTLASEAMITQFGPFQVKFPFATGFPRDKSSPFENPPPALSPNLAAEAGDEGPPVLEGLAVAQREALSWLLHHRLSQDEPPVETRNIPDLVDGGAQPCPPELAVVQPSIQNSPFTVGLAAAAVQSWWADSRLRATRQYWGNPTLRVLRNQIYAIYWHEAPRSSMQNRRWGQTSHQQRVNTSEL